MLLDVLEVCVLYYLLSLIGHCPNRKLRRTILVSVFMTLSNSTLRFY